jgi:nucleoid-associated protein YgaU
MSKQYLQWRFLAPGLTLLLVAGLALAACGGAAESAQQTAATTESAAATDTPTAEAQAQESAATEEPAAESAAPTAEESPAAQAAIASCQGIEIPDNTLIAAVSDSDWTKGPADAPVTLIEYGDFQ